MGLGLHADDRNVELLQPNLTWEAKVVKILYMARCRELTEYKKLGFSLPTRFCGFNIAFFDLDKVTAWTTGKEKNKIVLYNKKVAAGESVRGLVAVPVDERLVLRVCLFKYCEHEKGKCFQLSLGHGVDEYLAGKEPFELQVKISWRGVTNRRGPGKRGRPNMWWNLGTKDRLLL